MGAFFMSVKIELPLPVESERINRLLGRALVQPHTLVPEEIREIAESVLCHILRKPWQFLDDHDDLPGSEG